ncbi:hypothetical protein FYC62_04605 [Pedobacter aquae]|uniref:Uncharacterized protein n=1 Tax=Pedobacter aquae TaxID=2605747 RepID=A0A5C0VGL6_9SPHI|nr:hypothetical protein [Pedobacter aquae]QEK51032.1 hypothetical protein FYC62_04605 [Pedobacter aquae]
MLLLLPQKPANSIQVHYWFADESHTMDALVQNRCEYEFLALVKEIANIYDLDIVIETEPLANGGLKRWYKAVLKKESKSGVIKIALVTSLATAVLVTPINTIVGELTKHLIEKLLENKSLEEAKKKNIDLQNEKLQLEIQNLKESKKDEQIFNNNIIKKRRSNFYEAIDRHSKITKISFVSQNDLKEDITEEYTINKSDFKKFILTSDEIESEIVPEAIIEIIAPVLKKGSYKWIGIYKGETYHFNMNSIEFKTLVQIGDVEFKNGSSINCELEIKKKLNSDGTEKITGYNIIRVNSYFQNSEPIETKEGKRYRQSQEAIKQQTKLDI